MADGYQYGRRPVGGGDGDLQEEDVWAVMSYGGDEGGNSAWSRKAVSSSNPASSSPNPGHGRRPSGSSSSRMIPRSSSSGWASRQSAPVNIPDWSKIYKATGADGPPGSRYSRSGRGGGVNVVAGGSYYDEYGARDAADDDEDEDGVVPPHEWLAKKHAGSQISSFSMFEGVGRTLKGRDLRTIRNAVLTKTGFLE